MTGEKLDLATLCWITIATLSAFLCLIQLGVMMSLLSGRVGLAAVAPLALVLTLLLGYRLGRKAGLTGRRPFLPIGLALSILGFSVLLSAWYFDLSWDGQSYHQTAVYAIARDWNPLVEPMRAFGRIAELWVRHYAKGTWYVAAAVYETTGQIDIGKFPAVLAWFVTALAVFAAGLDGGLRRTHAAGIALVVALNPVVMSELTTYLVDGIMFGFLVVVIAAVFSSFQRPQAVVLWAGFSAAIVCINAKFTGLVFLCFVFAAGWLWCAAWQRERLLRYTALTSCALVVGAGLFGYNPYITNAVYRHMPFYPVLGSAAFPSLTQQGREGIEIYETPKNFLGHNRFFRLAYATFGRPGNQPYRDERDAHLMWPFAARPSDLFYYKYHETRVAGFGPFFSGALLFSLGLAIWLFLQPIKARGLVVLTALTIVASLLISLHLWWPRYGPQLWLLPIVPATFIFAKSSSRWALGATWALLALLAVNALLVSVVRMQWETKATQTLRKQLMALRDSGQTIGINFPFFPVSGEARLNTWGIKYIKIGRNEARSGTELMSVVEGYPGAVRYRLAPSIPRKPE